MKHLAKKDVINILSKINMDADIKALDPAMDLPSQGIDSLDMMSILFEFEETFSIKITDESVKDGQWLTIDKMVENINELLVKKKNGT